MTNPGRRKWQLLGGSDAEATIRMGNCGDFERANICTIETFVGRLCLLESSSFDPRNKTGGHLMPF